MHSDIDAVERTQILHDLRAGEFDVLVGINLLREGLDLPEVSLVGIFDVDKEGFPFHPVPDPDLWSCRSECQRNGDPLCRQVHRVDATNHRYHRKPSAQANGLQPGTRHHSQNNRRSAFLAPVELEEELEVAEGAGPFQSLAKLENELEELEEAMRRAAEALEFEEAAGYRDRIADQVQTSNAN